MDIDRSALVYTYIHVYIYSYPNLTHNLLDNFQSARPAGFRYVPGDRTRTTDHNTKGDYRSGLSQKNWTTDQIPWRLYLDYRFSTKWEEIMQNQGTDQTTNVDYGSHNWGKRGLQISWIRQKTQGTDQQASGDLSLIFSSIPWSVPGIRALGCRSVLDADLYLAFCGSIKMTHKH